MIIRTYPKELLANKFKEAEELYKKLTRKDIRKILKEYIEDQEKSRNIGYLLVAIIFLLGGLLSLEGIKNLVNYCKQKNTDDTSYYRCIQN